MKIKCDYCGSLVEEQNNSCPNCGATLNGVNRLAGEQPQTIEELKAWYASHNLPPENVTRFFIGKDIREPKAFGIYRDSKGDYIVYKNKSDGQRAIRYQGTDEAYAVNELYQKLKGEIAARKSKSATRQYDDNAAVSARKKKTRGGMFPVFYMIMLVMGISFVYAMVKQESGPSRGYYRYANQTYYYQNSSWYYYDDTDDDWEVADTDLPEEVYSDSREYRIYNHEGKRFEDSIWYVEDTYDDDDWDSDYDWDSNDSWDSGDTDWDSDWRIRYAI